MILVYGPTYVFSPLHIVWPFLENWYIFTFQGIKEEEAQNDKTFLDSH